MRIRRKTSTCLNCHKSISDVYNFCPSCGQENTTTNLSFGILFKEFFSNYFSLDSRFGRSIRPFLTKPGFLTNAFNEGKRVMYAHPVRLYLVISLFHFFLFSFVSENDFEDNEGTLFEFNEEDRPALDSLLALSRDQRPNDPEEWPAQDWEIELIAAMHSEGHSEEEILDSLHVSERPLLDRLAFSRMVRLSNASGNDISSLIVENIPVMMFFILPLYALLLKIFYWRRGLYIHHVIHSLHIHSFTFFAFGIAWLITLVAGEEVVDVAGQVVLFIVSIYILMSLKKVYQQKWGTTILKFLAIGFNYMILLSIALLVEVLLSLAFY